MRIDRERMSAYDVPGMSLSVIDDGEIVHESAYGVRKAGSSDPVTTQTLFQACSISKPIVALTMLRLVERGLLSLDADVNESLTSWRVPPSGNWQSRISLRQLASHTAGLTTAGFPGYRRDEEIPSLLDILSGTAPANTPGIRVDTVPGTQFRYAGGGTTVMHQLLEDVTGVPLPTLVADLVLEPLGMLDSYYAQPLPLALHSRAASAHLRDGSVVPGGWHVYPELAAAGLWTTPSDLARYAIGVQRAFAGEPGSLLSPELARQMLTSQAPSGRADFEGIGLGPFVGGTGTSRRFGHGGGNEGFKCQLVAYRDLGKGAAIMTNSDNGRELCAELLDGIATELDWPDWPQRTEPWRLPDPAVLDGYVGSYQLPDGPSLSVARQGVDLRVTFDGQPPITFYEDEGASYFGGNVVDTRLTFAEAVAGRSAMVTFTQNGVDVECPRLR